MTNVPGEIREIWTDLYKLFDKHYAMDIREQESWDAYWKDAIELTKKYQEVPTVIDFVDVISEFICKLKSGEGKIHVGHVR